MRGEFLRRGFILAVLPLLLSGVAAGQEQNVSFAAAVDKNPVGTGDQFTLSLVLSNAGTSGGSNLRPPDLGAFRIIAGPNRSTNMQIINGQMSSSFALMNQSLACENLPICSLHLPSRKRRPACRGSIVAACSSIWSFS